MLDVKKIIKENEVRVNHMFSPYDPIKGIGSPIDRFELKVTPTRSVFLPMSMRDEYWACPTKSVQDDYPLTFDRVMHDMSRDRLKHDFEYFAALCAKIKPKDGGGSIPFVPNRSQRRLLNKLEKMRVANKPIRLILLKARQWGGSTLIQIYMAWIQLFHKTNWNSLIAAHVKQAAAGIRFMYNTIEKHFPKEVLSWSLRSFENTTNIKVIPERSNRITIGSMEKPDSIRSEDISMAHLSEVGLWKKTEGKEPKDMAQTILGTVPSLPLSMYVLESTAKGVGNYFHSSWLKAINGESNMVPVIVPWFEIENYRFEFESNDERIDFINSMKEYDIILWNLGATLEGIKWYRWKLAEFEGDTWRMQSEFPSTAEEAFQSTGRRVFRPSYVANIRRTLKSPILIGDIYGDAMKGPDSLNNVRIESKPKGSLHLFKNLNDPAPDTGKRILRRYCAFADIGGRTNGADYSAISVFDRYWMIDGGLPERVLTWKGHVDQDIFAWICAQVAKMCDNALLAVEVNSLRQKDSDTEGDHFYTILDEISDHYDNLYSRTKPEQVRAGLPDVWGFHTNQKSKGQIIDNYTALLRDNGYIEYDERVAAEADVYEIKQDGSMGAVDGNNDDVLITTMGGLWLATKYMDLPKIVDIDRKYRSKRRSSYAQM